MRLIYLAHPYGGDPENITRSAELAEKLTKQYTHTHFINAVGHFAGFAGLKDEKWIMHACLDLLQRCDALWVGPGWETSPGCGQEIAEARKMGMAIVYIVDKRPTQGQEATDD